MTESDSGSSLLQARDVHHASHNKHHRNHIRSRHQHQKLHDHARRDDDAATTTAATDSDDDDTIVEIVRTVSVVQLIDSTGAIVGATTQISEPTTTTALADAVSFKVANIPGVSSAADAVTALVAEASSTTSSTTSADATPTSMPSSSFPSVESFAQITSALSDSSSVFPTYSGVSNSTQPASTTTSSSSSSTPAAQLSLFASNETASVANPSQNITTASASASASASTTALFSSSGTVIFNSLSSTVGLSTSTDYASPSATASSTGSEDGGYGTGWGYGGGATGTAATGVSSATSTSTDSAAGSGSKSSSSAATAGKVAGSVIGAVAGISLIVMVAMILLRYKKRQRGLRLSDGNGLPGTRGLVLGGGGGGGAIHSAPSSPPLPQGGPSMAEASESRSTPFAIPAALANLTGNRFSQRSTSSEGTERGFQKVSGRKLPSVLQHGGDGYSDPTDPRDTVWSERSIYRDSQGTYGGPGMPRLAVGSPMRPESGIPVFHAGPARVAVTESSYFDPNLLPAPARDPFGRAPPSQDGSYRSHGSGSRFTEEI